MRGAEILGTDRHGERGRQKLAYRYRWFKGALMREGRDAFERQRIGLAIADAKGKTTYDGALVTSLEVLSQNVAEIAACARARRN